jgi:hypothetical protein
VYVIVGGERENPSLLVQNDNDEREKKFLKHCHRRTLTQEKNSAQLTSSLKELCSNKKHILQKKQTFSTAGFL